MNGLSNEELSRKVFIIVFKGHGDLCPTIN
jgi:hypothetical protein